MDSLKPQVNVHFYRYKKVEFGHALYVVGSIPQLGDWNPRKAIKLIWQENHNWAGVVAIPAPCDFEYKYIISAYDGPKEDFIKWEPGPNFKMVVQPLSKKSIETGKKNVSVMSFNLRYATPSDGLNYWENRKDIVANIIKLSDCDFVGTQEGLINQIRDLGNLLPMYSSYGRYRGKNEDEDESSTIFYQNNKWQIEKADTFWLSDYPNIPGSATFGNRIPRIATWVKFRNAYTMETVFVYNCHFDHENVRSQRKAAELIARHIETNCAGEKNVILMGDFNVTDDDETIGVIKGNGLQLEDTCNKNTYMKAEKGTFHDWTGAKDGMKIDYIFIHPDLKVQEFQIVHDNFNNRYPSDHFPITAKVSLCGV